MGSPANRSLAKFPANREKYREICEFGLKKLLEDTPIWLNKRPFTLPGAKLKTQTEQGIIAPVTGIWNSLLGPFGVPNILFQCLFSDGTKIGRVTPRC